MVLNLPRTQAGLHSATFINKTSGIPYGILKVLASYTPALTRESSDLFGGSNPNAIDSIDGNIDNSLTIVVKEFKNFLYELAGYTVEKDVTGETNGATANFTDSIGTSIVDATTGIASVAIDTANEASVKDGRYYVIAVSATTVDIYLTTDIQADRGTDISFLTDDLKIKAAQTIPGTSGTLDINDLGLTFTGGSGTVAMTTGDVAYFDVRSKNEGRNIYTLGNNPTPIEFELWLYSQRKSNQEFFADHYPRVKFNTVPTSMTTNEWVESEIACKVMYDSTFSYSQRRFDIIKDLS